VPAFHDKPLPVPFSETREMLARMDL
jgi:hypothetical protein